MRSETKRQKKLAKKRTKQLRERRQLARTKQQLTSLAGQMASASHCPIHGCFVGMGTEGMTTVVLARKVAGGKLAFAVFLLDLYCLGVKNALGHVGTPADLDKILARVRENEGLQQWPPSHGRKLVEGAIEYAEALGLAPHPDCRKVMPLWGEIDASECEETFEFGRDGKPMYVAGPHDSLARQNYIMSRLTEAAGEGNFDYMLAMRGDAFSLVEMADMDDAWDEHEMIGERD